MSKSSIRDVAQLADVSLATVSRVLGGADYPVRPDLREKVLKAAAELHYQPNRIAQNLRSRNTNVIGLLVRDISDHYFADIAKGVTDEASRRGLMTLVCTTQRDHAKEVKVLETLSQYKVKGIILAGAGWRNDAENYSKLMHSIDVLKKEGVRIVCCAPHQFETASVTVDNEAIGKMAFREFEKQGHRKFLVLGGDEDNLSSYYRIRGFIELALSTGCCVIKDETENSGTFTWEYGSKAVEKLLPTHPDATAVFCTNDNIAFGVLSKLLSMGIRVPEDISVLGVGDVDVAAFSTPPLSTFKVPFVEIGRQAVNMIEDKAQPNIVLQSTFVSRGSVSTVKA